jgi:hypothetical protein
MAYEMWDFLSTGGVAADSSTELTIIPQHLLLEQGKKNVVIHTGDDGSEQRIVLDRKPIFRVRLRWDYLSANEAGVIVNMFYSTSAGHGTARTFRWEHPLDGHKYTVRFDGELGRNWINAAGGPLHGISEISLRILGRAT